MKLSDRLETVISLVNPAKTAADIGTDHGYVPVELVRRGIVTSALAMDVRKGPLARAEEHILQSGLGDQITARLSDGLIRLDPGEADCVVIAGMGGELILHILEDGRHMWNNVSQWILSPHSEVYKVRKWMRVNGFHIEREKMVTEEGKYYNVLDIRRLSEGEEDLPDEDGDFYGRDLIDRKDPVLIAYLVDEAEKLQVLEKKLAQAKDSSYGARKSYEEILDKLRRNREVYDAIK